jgi:hypothetical protein
MRKFTKFTAFLAAVLVLGASGIAMAGATATQTVTYEVQAINELSVSSATASLAVNAAVAGSAPTAVTDASTTYAITTNEAKKITGAIDTAMPTGVTLKVTLAAPAGGTSSGDVTLSAIAADLVTGIATLNESGKTITYNLSATSAAGVVASATKTVTLTITAGI